MAPGTVAVLTNVTKKPAARFGPLNSVLGDISAVYDANHEVRLQFPYLRFSFD